MTRKKAWQIISKQTPNKVIIIYYNFIYSRIIKINKNMYIYNSQIANKVNKIKQKKNENRLQLKVST